MQEDFRRQRSLLLHCGAAVAALLGQTSQMRDKENKAAIEPAYRPTKESNKERLALERMNERVRLGASKARAKAMAKNHQRTKR